jgi:hypothetical protein
MVNKNAFQRASVFCVTLKQKNIVSKIVTKVKTNDRGWRVTIIITDKVMSHIKNTAAFEKLLGYCTGYGGAYNPGSPNLSIQFMTTKLREAQKALEDAKIARSNLNNESNHREIAFDAIPKLASSILFTLASSGASEQSVNDARVYLRQIAGRRMKDRKPVGSAMAAPSEVPAETIAKDTRVPQTDYVSKADHFAKLVQLVSAEPGYQPNETFLRMNGLNDTLSKLQKLNTTVAQAQVDWSNKKIARNKLLYEDGSLLETARLVKKYVRGAFGLQSAEYQQISKLDFTKPVIG